MQKTLEFKTTHSKDRIIKILKKHTYYTDSISPPIFFLGNEYFFGQVSESRIRLGKTEFSGRAPSPLYELFLTSGDGYTEVLVHDDTEEKIYLAKVLFISIGTAICFVFFTVGTVLSIKHPESYSFSGTVMICMFVAAFATIGLYLNKVGFSSRQRKDLNYLQQLLKG